MKNTRSILLALCFIVASMSLRAQDSIRYRIIFIGDAGEIDPAQRLLIPQASSLILPNRTSVMYLGDNIYPTGMGLPGSPEEEQTKNILRSQYQPMRAKGAPVYFIPGNHDWDKMGPKGLVKIKREWSFLGGQHDSLLQLVPPDGCPDPVEIDVSDSLTIIAFDSEWWLFPYAKDNPDGQCSCVTKKDVTDKMRELLYKNRYKVILLASHHPFQSYGHHGGYFSLKDHLFPLTAASKDLYIPLPVIGSLYPLLRSTFLSPEDMAHPLYKDMIKQVDEVFDSFPNLIHVAGHEHGLQFIKDNQVQVVSGAGAKEAFVKQGKHALYARTIPGFVVGDLLAGNAMRFTYYTVTDSALSIAFTYTQPYTNFKAMEDAAFTATVDVDSISISANAGFNSVSGIHRALFGENYRKDWGVKARLPVIKLSEVEGGLTPLQRGGGHQTHSLRLVDKQGREWVLRSVNKFPEVLLPEELRETFAKDIITDAMSAQHPYSALVVPIVATAAGVPHAHPMIGWVAPDKALGLFSRDFENTVCLLEEREPTGKSDNSAKMYKELTKDNDNSLDSTEFLKARLLDLFIGDWDRHEDQWRWFPEKKDKGIRYIAVPRDRDQVFHVDDGLFPTIATRPWIEPMIGDFDGKIKRVNAFFTESNDLNKRFLSQFSYDQWMRITGEFKTAMTDSVIEAALQTIPKASYDISHDKLLRQWRQRRDNLPAAMSEYYGFMNRIVDIQTSDKNELVELTDAPGGGMTVHIRKITKEGKIKDHLYDRVFDPAVTREIRLYIHNGNDSVVVNNHSSIRLRIIGGAGDKVYNVIASEKKISLYDKRHDAVFDDPEGKLNKHLSNDSARTAYVSTNPYNRVIPALAFGYNADDGILLGASVKFVNQGFRKRPYGNVQELSFAHAFSSNAFISKYHGEWLKALGSADFTTDAKALAPDVQNFFGVGNATDFDRVGDYKQYYRSRFSVYQIDPALRWRSGKTSSFSVGPSWQYYHFDRDDNQGRFVTQSSLLHTYDSTTVGEDKMFAGIIVKYIHDTRNSKLIPTQGGYVDVKLQGYTGLNTYSKSFAQVLPGIAFYKAIDNQSWVVLADRISGGVTVGKAAFYQSMFLGGQENLLGYKQYRFAGQDMVSNNLEARIKLANVGSYILPGQLGIVGFYDIGKVWASGYNSDTWHQGVGGGLYFAPAQMAVVRFVMGHSTEGWYPYFTVGMRF